MEQQSNKQSDRILCAVFACIGLLFVYEGANMPGPETISYIEKGGEPGRMPVILGVINLILAVILFFRKPFMNDVDLDRDKTAERQLAIQGLTAGLLCTLFALGFILSSIRASENLFEVLCFLFIALFVILFEWNKRKNTARLLLSAAAFSLVTTAVTVVVFEKLLLVSLP